MISVETLLQNSDFHIPTKSAQSVSKGYSAGMLSEEALIEGCVGNTRACQAELYSRYGRKMLMVCQRYLRTTEDAEDVLQEGFVKVFLNIKTFKKEAKLETWMTRVFINAALNHHRQKLRLFPMIEVEESTLITSDDINLSNIHLEDLLEMIKSLPDGCRVVFNLFAIEGYTHKDIAGMMNISEGTSKSQYNRAKALLKDRLHEYENEYARRGQKRV